MICMLKKKNISGLCFKTSIISQKTSYSFNDSKRKRMAISCSKKTVSVIKRITFKRNGDFYCLNCLHFFRTKQNLTLDCIKEYDRECLIEKTDGCKINPENSLTKKVSEHIP